MYSNLSRSALCVRGGGCAHARELHAEPSATHDEVRGSTSALSGQQETRTNLANDR